MNYLTRFQEFFALFADITLGIVDGLKLALLEFTTIDISAITLNLLIFSETPIISITLYNLLYLTVFTVLIIWVVSLLIWIIQAPINAFKRYLS